MVYIIQGHDRPLLYVISAGSSRVAETTRAYSSGNYWSGIVAAPLSCVASCIERRKGKAEEAVDDEADV